MAAISDAGIEGRIQERNWKEFCFKAMIPGQKRAIMLREKTICALESFLSGNVCKM